MKRRSALKSMVVISSAITFLPSCDMEVLPVYENIPIDKKQRKLIEHLTEAMLPKKNTEIITPEKTIDYLLTVINDCHAPEEIEEYMGGLNEFQLLLKEKYNSSFQKLNPESQQELFAFLMSPENNSDNLNHFFSTTFNLTKHHFTTSEYFMKNNLEFEFAPGRYLGCVEV